MGKNPVVDFIRMIHKKLRSLTVNVQDTNVLAQKH